MIHFYLVQRCRDRMGENGGSRTHCLESAPGLRHLIAMNGTMLSDRALLRLSGEDVRGFLQGLVTQDLNAVEPDKPQWAGLLTAQGKVLFDFILWADGDDILIDCEAAAADSLSRRLMLYRLRRPIAVKRDVDLNVHWAPIGDQGFPDPRLAALGRRWLGPVGEPAEGWHEHRLSLGVPEGIGDLGSDKTLWLEANAAELNGVSFTKGCYVGQENTARMNWRQKINRRLVVVDGQVERRNVDALGDALIPDWLADTLKAQEQSRENS